MTVRRKFSTSGSRPSVHVRDSIDKLLDPAGWEQRRKEVTEVANIERACQGALLLHYLEETGLKPSEVELCVEMTVHQSKYWFQPRTTQSINARESVVRLLRELATKIEEDDE